MKTLSLAIGLAVTLCPSAAAQLAFDYITFDRVVDDTPGFSSFLSNQGILVNTGTVPIDLGPMFSNGALFYSTVQGPLSAQAVNLNANASPLVLLEPGQAIGTDDPQFTALLAPGELLTPASQLLVLNYQKSPDNSTSTVSTRMQIGDQRVAFDQEVVLGDGTTGTRTFGPVRRYSSTPSDALFALWGESCGSGGTAMPMRALGTGGIDGNGLVSSSSNMPVVGNPAFRLLAPEPFYPQAGIPWLLVLSTAPAAFDLAGCSAFVDLGAPGSLVIPGVTEVVFPEFEIYTQVEAQLPIPANQALIGLDLWVQAMVVWSGSDNGILTLSDAKHLVIGT